MSRVPKTNVLEPKATRIAHKLAPRSRKRALTWLAGKGDLFADEFVKAFAKALGMSAGAALAGLTFGGALLAILVGLSHWLGS